MEEQAVYIPVPQIDVMGLLKKFGYIVVCSILFASSTFFYTMYNCGPGSHLISMLLFIVFMVFVELLWNEFRGQRKPLGTIFKYAIYSSLLFFLLSSKDVYLLTNKVSIFGSLADTYGCPSSMGIFIHSIIFAIAMISTMGLPENQ